jgi:urease accessory protein
LNERLDLGVALGHDFVSGGSGWLGRLSLELEKTEHGTQLARSQHEGPLRIQRVLKPEGADCPHLYLLHPPGGVVGGDRLETRVSLGAGAHVLLTTPAAQKLYRSQGARAEISNHLTLGAGARLEWLPSETLAFPSAQATIQTRVDLAEGAAFMGWDVACYGMPARGETFTSGRVLTRFEIYRTGTPLAIESLDVGPGGQLLTAPFALRAQPVVATLYVVPAQGAIEPATVDEVRDALGAPGRNVCSVSSLGELLVVRALGPNVEGIRAPLIRAWQLLRRRVLGRDPVTPRIWAT